MTDSASENCCLTRARVSRAAAFLAATLLPVIAASSVWAQVSLNEVMAFNQSIILPNNDVTDYIELHNPSGSPVPLQGWRLTDTPTNVAKYTFPAGVTIPPGGYLLVYCDNLTNSAGLHTGFGLNRDGSYVGLVSPNGTPAESMAFGLQVQDHSLGRHASAGGDFTLNTPTPGQANLAEELGDPLQLMINEWMALSVSASGANFKTNSDWVELYNPTTNVVALGGLLLSDASPPLPVLPALHTLSYIPAQGFLRIYADDKTNPANHVRFKLSSTSGDQIYLFRSDRSTLIDSVTFGPQAANESMGRLPDGAANIVVFPYKRDTPGDSNFTPLTNSVVVNEVLAHTDPPLEDAIEILNPTSASIDIGGWYISNEKLQQKKFRIPPGTVLPPGGFKLFYEDDFNPARTGNDPNFTLNSAHGDNVYLFPANANGDLTGYFIHESFDSSANGVSFGRYINSEGKSDFVSMARRSFGQDNPPDLATFRQGTGVKNPLPLVGPLVINEIMYHPPDILSGTNRFDDNTNEFIEIINIASTNVFLFDPQIYWFADGRTNTWRLRGTVDFEFPTGVTLESGQTLVVVNFDPDNATNSARLAAFKARYDVPPSVRLFGPYRGKLSNNGATIELRRADPPQDNTHPDFRYVPYVITDRVKYGDLPPWPTAADGNSIGIGKSLQRRDPGQYGDEAGNWIALEPSAGRVNLVSPPKFTTQPKSLNVVAGSNVVLTVVVSGAPPLVLQWFRNGSALATETSDTLQLPGVMPTNAGAYFVVASNSFGATTSLVANLVVDCGLGFNAASLAVSPAGGSPVVEVTGGVGCTWSAFSTNDWIQIPDSGRNNTGGASFPISVALNRGAARVGSVNVGGELLVVRQAAADQPSIATQPRSLAIVAGADAVFRVVANGTPPLDYQWYLNGSPLLGQTADTLTVPGALPINAGGYSVVVSSPFGSITSSVANLTVDCGFVFNPPSVSMSAAGGTPSVQVTGGAGCLWSAFSTNTWIQIPSAASNVVGGATFAVVVTTNSGPPRVGAINVGGKLLLVTQYAVESNKPVVSITAPLANASTTGTVMTVKGVASDNIELSLVELSVNGGPTQLATASAGSSRKLWNWAAAANLEPGTNIVTAQATDLSGNKSLPVSRKFFRAVKQPLGVAVSGGTASLINGALLNIGQGYSITATPRTGQVFSNWTRGGVVVGTSAALKFLMETGLVLQANFVPNPFPPVSGTYAGLFYEAAEVRHDRSGSFTLALGTSGTYSGRLNSGIYSVPFTGKLTLDGLATNRIVLGTSVWWVEWVLDLSPSRLDRIAGTVRGSDWTARLDGDRPWFNTTTNPSPFAASYTLAITGKSDAAIQGMGSGFGTASAARGGLFSMSGSLADSTAVTFAGAVSKSGEVPFYLRLYGGRGSMLGWLAVRGTNGTPALESDLNWFRPVLPLPLGKLYPAGFNNRSKLVGSVYRAPVPNTRRVVNIENGQVSFDGGNVSVPFVNYVTLSTNNLVRNDTNLSPNRLTMTITTASGLFSGQAQVPGGTRLLLFRGAVLPDFASGLGFFVGTNETGGVRFETRP